MTRIVRLRQYLTSNGEIFRKKIIKEIWRTFRISMVDDTLASLLSSFLFFFFWSGVGLERYVSFIVLVILERISHVTYVLLFFILFCSFESHLFDGYCTHCSSGTAGIYSRLELYCYKYRPGSTALVHVSGAFA